MTDLSCYRVRSWQRRADTLARKMDELMTDIHEIVMPQSPVELSIVNHCSRLVDELDMLVCNLDALASEVSK